MPTLTAERETTEVAAGEIESTLPNLDSERRNIENWNVLATPPGSFGLAMCVPFLNNGHAVTAGFRDQAKADKFKETYADLERLPEVQLPSSLRVTADLETAVKDADLIVLATPSRYLREFYLQRIMPFMRKDALLLCLTKGLEPGTNLRPSEVIRSLDPKVMERYAVMGGPNIASEIAIGLPAITHIASESMDVATKISDALFRTSPKRFRPYPSSDIIGVETGAAAKGAYTIGAGICDGSELGDNARAGFIQRAWVEITRINEAEGGQEKTLTGPSGFGDLIACCTSEKSRNYQAGVELAKGKTRKEILRSGKTYEGFHTSRALVELAKKHCQRWPIVEGICAVSYGFMTVNEAVEQLLEYDRLV